MKPHASFSKTLFLVFSVLLFIPAPSAGWAAEAPVVFWASNPVHPGEAVLFYGDSLENVDEIRFLRLADESDSLRGAPSVRQPPAEAFAAKPVQPSETAVKSVIPQQLQPGVFVAWLHTSAGWSQPVFLNRPDPWWVQGDEGTYATPGGWIRVLGIALGSLQQRGKPRLRLVGTAIEKPIFVDGTDGDAYSIKVSVPNDIPSGRYQVSVHNGSGGVSTWAGHLFIDVQKPGRSPATVLNIKDFGGVGDGTHDDTTAVVQALTMAAQEGGGVVYFPRGLYKITSTLRIPPRTILRGEKQELVDLFWPDEGRMLPAVIQGKHSFGLEDLTLHFSLAQHGIVAEDSGPQAGNVFLRHVRARWLLYSGQLKPEIVDQRFRQSLQHSTGGGDLVRLTGKNIEIRDCDLYSSGRVLILTGVEGALIARNTLYNGRWGWYTITGGERIIFEQNRVIGADLMSTGGGLDTLGSPSSQYIYFAHNTFQNLYGWDREAMTTDGGGGDYIGTVASASSTTVTYPRPHNWKPDSLKHKALYILAGKGKGQYRRIRSNVDRTVTVERPWDVVPDSTSVVGITWMRGHYLFIGNTVVDASIAIQVYGVAFNTVVAENRSVRAGGFHSHAARYLGDYNVPVTQGVQPQMFVQYLDNEIIEGSSYNKGGNNGSVVGLQAFAPSNNWQWPMALGFIFRGNKLNSHARLRLLTPVEGTALVEDVVIEKNRVENSPIGIEVGARSTRILIRGNHFKEVANAVIGGSQTAVGGKTGPASASVNNEFPRGTVTRRITIYLAIGLSFVIALGFLWIGVMSITSVRRGRH